LLSVWKTFLINLSQRLGLKRLCPTVHELLAFDAVARLGSVTEAANSLCVTASAVSKQLARLEVFVGRALTEKDGRGVRLTAHGKLYWPKVSSSLHNLEIATLEMRSGDVGSASLTLASVPTFLTKWLIPRLPDFLHKHPSVTLSFSQHLGPNEELHAGVDAAIRYGTGDWPAVTSDYIAGKEFVLIAAPRLVASGGLKDRARIAEQTLLHHDGAPSAWRLWAAENSVDPSRVQSGPRFAQYSALIQAAVSGLGVGLAPRILVAQEMKDGTVTTPCGRGMNVDQGHYLCFRPEHAEAPALVAFRSWILAQAKLPVL
jgi:LysR family transcriptional regulator, glycine cleavage system transcriptional activator